MATAIYMRVSTEKQEETGVSLDTQKDRLNAYCTMKGFTNIKEYLDVGSGRTTDKRVSFNHMMEDVENGFISNVVILKLDRLTRSIIDLNNLVSQLNDNDCELHSCTENIDTTTASGRMMMNLIGTFAQWESETISERVIINMQSVAEKGIWQSSVPYGFNLGKDRRLEVNEEEKNILNDAFELVIKGNSFSYAEEKIKSKYNLDWHRGFLLKKVRMESTVGNIYRSGTVIKDTHEPLISKSLRDKLLTIAEERGNPRTQIFDGDLFRRKVLCPQCDKILSLRANKSEKDKSNLFSYCCHECYRNGKGMLSVSERIIEQAFINHLDTQLIEYNTADMSSDNDDKEIKKLKARLRSIQKERERIQKAWIKGFMKDHELVEHQNELEERYQATQKRLDELGKTETISNEEILQLQHSLKSGYEYMTKEEKKLFIQTHIKEIRIERNLLKGYKKKYRINVTAIAFY